MVFLYVPKLVPHGVVLDGEPVHAITDYLHDLPALNRNAKLYLRQDPDGAFDTMLERFGAVIVSTSPEKQDEIWVFSHGPVKLPTTVLDHLKVELGLWESTPVWWYTKLFIEPKSVNAGVVLYGKRPTAESIARQIVEQLL